MNTLSAGLHVGTTASTEQGARRGPLQGGSSCCLANRRHCFNPNLSVWQAANGNSDPGHVPGQRALPCAFAAQLLHLFKQNLPSLCCPNAPSTSTSGCAAAASLPAHVCPRAFSGQRLCRITLQLIEAALLHLLPFPWQCSCFTSFPCAAAASFPAYLRPQALSTQSGYAAAA